MATHPSPTPTTVGAVMRPAVTTVDWEAHLAGAAYVMKQSGATALVVTTEDADRRPLAILTDTDISQAVADGRDLEQVRIRDLHPRPLVTVPPVTTVGEAALVMLANKIHHLPVVEEDRLLGMVEMADVTRRLVPAAEETPA